MIQRIVKTELNSLIASSKIPSNRLQQTRIISRVGMGKKPARKLRNRRVRNFLINELKNNDKKRRSIGQKGRIKYNTHFNSTKVAKFIFEKTLNLKLSEKYFWDK